MKRLFGLILTLALCLSLCACGSGKDKIQQPVNFYYRCSELSYDTSDGLIRAYVAEAAGYTEVLPLLRLYLQGTTDAAFTSTFPAGIQLLDAYVMGKTIYLELNESMADLTGIDLTIACACLTMTALELVDATNVCISANGAAMDGSPSITMSLNDLILQDLYTPETTE